MEEARRQALALLSAGLITPVRLWVAFYGVGGSADAFELEGYVYGLIPVSETDAELLSDALLFLAEQP